eukprot:scaffold40415_cov168-Amphora_coffeaeformis.AAC.1
MKKQFHLPCLLLLVATLDVESYNLTPPRLLQQGLPRSSGATRLFHKKDDDSQDELRKPAFKTSLDDSTTTTTTSGSSISSSRKTIRMAGGAEEDKGAVAASTRTVNERLLAELQQAADKEKYGNRSELTKKFSLDMFQSTKTDEERRLAIEEARNLNGVNPVVTGVASVVALAAAFGLWIATTKLGVFFATHPVDSDWYVVQRSTAVFRNVAVGLVSLAAGFCGVTGLGIGLLTGRVAVGVVKGELDPTPLPTKPGDEVQLPN